MITYLELGITDGVSVSLVSPWPWRSAAKQSNDLLLTCNFLYCNNQVHRDFLFNLYTYMSVAYST
jgi:hypothetical protein